MTQEQWEMLDVLAIRPLMRRCTGGYVKKPRVLEESLLRLFEPWGLRELGVKISRGEMTFADIEKERARILGGVS